MKNKAFILIFLVTLAFAVFTQSEFSRFMLGFEFLLEITLFVSARILSRYVDKTMCPPTSEATKGQEIPLEVQLRNHCIFPISELQVELKCRDEYSGKVDRLQGTAMLDGKDETVLRFVLQSHHYGVLSVWPERIDICDPLGINYVVSRFTKQVWEVAVLPALAGCSPQLAESDSVKHVVDDGDAANGKGEDPSFAYELRAYREGESLRNVHWKLSAKTDELMVKEFGKNTEPMTLVFLDLSCHGRKYSRSEWDSFLETVADFSVTQLQAGNRFQMLWIDTQLQPHHIQVRQERDVILALTALLHEKPHSGSVDEISYKEKLPHEAYNATVCINLLGEIIRKEAAD